MTRRWLRWLLTGRWLRQEVVEVAAADQEVVEVAADWQVVQVAAADQQVVEVALDWQVLRQ